MVNKITGQKGHRYKTTSSKGHWSKRSGVNKCLDQKGQESKREQEKQIMGKKNYFSKYIGSKTGVQNFIFVQHRGFRVLICPTKSVFYIAETVTKGHKFLG